VNHLISYSLYGTGQRYTVGAIKNAVLSQRYQGFDLRFYVGESVPEWVTSTLSLFKNVEIVQMYGNEDGRAMFWRFYALADLNYDYVLVRDVDARLNDREIDMHYEFVESGKGFHIIKDHPTGHNYLISGGMLAAKRITLHDIHKLIDAWGPKPGYLNDMEFLWTMVYPRISNDCFIHDEYFNTPGSVKSRTKKRHTLDMVGAAVNEDDIFIYDNDVKTAMDETGGDKYLV
jgi:hypothetical protein